MRKHWWLVLAGGLVTLSLGGLAQGADEGGKAKKIVLLGVKRDHGPGEHEYQAGLKILAECLKQTPGLDPVLIMDWPKDPKVLDDASALVCFLGAGGDYLLAKPERRAKVEELMKKGMGFVALHWAVEGKKERGELYMSILGGYYEPGFSKNPHNTTSVQPVGDHPITRGWKAFEARDEFYFNIRFLPEAKPVVRATLKDRDRKVYEDQTIGWVYTRKDSQGALGPGRSFGFTGCHFHVNFGIAEFRRLIVNGILWTADVEVPAEGAPVKLKGPVPKIP